MGDEASLGPIFVVGSLGSGSTLLRLMLDSHEHIAMPQETGFLRLALSHSWIPYWKFGGEWYERLGLTQRELDERTARHFGAMFEEYAAQRGKRRWGDKTPFHVWYVDLALRLFPNAVFVGIVRHPGGVISSLHGRFRYPWRRSVRHWNHTNRRLVHEAVQRPDTFALVRYEDLVREPEMVMRSLLDWLGEPWSPAVLDHHTVQPRSGNPRVVEGHTRSDAPIDADRAEVWTTFVDDTARRLLRDRAAPLASFFGYDVGDPHVRAPLSVDAATWTGLATGHTLLARLAAGHGSDVDWSAVPEASLENSLLLPPAPRRSRRNPRAARVDDPTSEGGPSVARRVVDRLPWRWHRLVHDYRRRHAGGRIET